VQLPVVTEHPKHIETGHVVRSAHSRLALNRVSASILMPNQSAVLLWQTSRSTAIRLSAAMVQSFRRQARKQHRMLAVDAGETEASGMKYVLAATPPKRPAAHKPEKNIAVKVAAG
jgi:hypothetical protein